MYIVYMHTCIVNNKRYVGFTSKGINKRWDKHCWHALHDPRFIFHRAIACYGVDAWQHEVLASVQTIDEARQLEQKFILEHRTFEPELGYNMTLGGEGTMGRELSEEHRRKIGQANRGRKHSEASRHNMSVSHQGKVQSEETKAKRIKSLIGHEVSFETREKIRARRKGRKMSEASRKLMSERAKERWKKFRDNQNFRSN